MWESLDQTLRGLAFPLTRLFVASDPASLLSLTGGLAVATIFLISSRGRGPDWREARDILRRASTRFEAKLYVVNSLVFVGALAVFIIGADVWRGWTLALLTLAFGATAPSPAPFWLAAGAATLAGFVAFDLGYYCAHRLAHGSPLLWRFHRQHHAARTLTPLTGFREHPVDTLLFANVIACATGVCAALAARATGSDAGPFTLPHLNALQLVYYTTFLHLRHSHLWMPLTGALGHFVQSPAHHQLHHAVDPALQGRNLGLALAVFDTLFGTLALPRNGPPERFGVEGEPPDESLADFYARPFETPLQKDRSSP